MSRAIADAYGAAQLRFADKCLSNRHIVIDGAFDYGLAIRHDGPFRPQVEALVCSD